MKNFYQAILLIFIVMLLGTSCASHQRNDGLAISVKEIKIEAWLNLMPGGPGSFHLAGEIKLGNNESCDIKNLSLTKISILQSDNQLYAIIPIFSPKMENSDTNILTDAEKNFLFTTASGLPVKSELDVDTPIKVILIFKEANDKTFLYEVENIKVQKVY